MTQEIRKTINQLTAPITLKNQEIDTAFHQLLHLCGTKISLQLALKELTKRGAETAATARGETRIYQRHRAIEIGEELRVQEEGGKARRGLIEIELDQEALDDLLDPTKLPEVREREKDHCRRKGIFERRVEFLRALVSSDTSDGLGTQNLSGMVARGVVGMLRKMVEEEDSILEVIRMEINNREKVLRLQGRF